jgi:hypothetical protein
MVTNTRQKIDEHYKGISVIDSEIDPLDFFNDYVSSRKPVKFSNIIKDESWKGDKWTNDILREKSGIEIIVCRCHSSIFVCMYHYCRKVKVT